jgi:hypothetical protein
MYCSLAVVSEDTSNADERQAPLGRATSRGETSSTRSGRLLPLGWVKTCGVRCAVRKGE